MNTKIIMKKTQLLFSLSIFSTLFFHVNAQSDPGLRGEKVFLKHADECLLVMDQAARNMSVKGVALLAFIPGDTTKNWISKMWVAGALTNGSANFLAIAYSKAAEMADLYKNSGSGTREPLHGEFGYQGGIIMKVDSGYILAVFSGASGEQDAEIANTGLQRLHENY